MISKRFVGIIVAITAVVSIFNTIGLVYDAFFYSEKDLPQGKLSYSVESPDGKETMSVYTVENSLGKAVRCCVSDKNGGETHNIYWNTGIDSVKAEWLDNTYVMVGDTMLNVNKDVYDSRSVVEELENRIPQIG